MTWKRQKLQIVKERDAAGRTKEIFEEIKQTLGVPYINTLFRVLASFPEFLDLFWNQARPVLNTQEFFSFSERISAEAYTCMHNYFSVPPLRAKAAEMNFSPGAQAELHDIVELYNYDCSVLLLLNAALVEAFENPGIEAQEATPVVVEPRYSRKPIMVEEDVAPAPTRKIYDEIKRALKTPFLSNWFLQLGRWPDFLNAYWESLRLLLRTPLYEHHRLAIYDSALSLAAKLPQPLQLSTAEMEEKRIPTGDIDTIVQVADLFLNLLSKQILNVAFAKIGLENGDRSRVAA